MRTLLWLIMVVTVLWIWNAEPAPQGKKPGPPEADPGLSDFVEKVLPEQVEVPVITPPLTPQDEKINLPTEEIIHLARFAKNVAVTTLDISIKTLSAIKLILSNINF